MNPTLRMDMDAFNDGIRKAIKTSSREGSLVINARAFHVALRAIKETQTANKNEIARELGKTALKVISGGKNKGKVKSILRDDSVAERIIISRARKAGAIDFVPYGDDLKKKANKLIAIRMVSAGFIRSGWISAMKDLGRFAFGAEKSTDGTKVVGKKKGNGTAAKPKNGLMKATIENSALLVGGKFASVPGNPMPAAEQGLWRAMALEYQEMQRHLAKKLKEGFRQEGFRLA